MKFGRTVLQVNMHRLMETVSDVMSYFQDGVYDVISQRKVLPPGDCTCSVCPGSTASASCPL